MGARQRDVVAWWKHGPGSRRKKRKSDRFTAGVNPWRDARQATLATRRSKCNLRNSSPRRRRPSWRSRLWGSGNDRRGRLYCRFRHSLPQASNLRELVGREQHGALLEQSANLFQIDHRSQLGFRNPQLQRRFAKRFQRQWHKNASSRTIGRLLRRTRHFVSIIARTMRVDYVRPGRVTQFTSMRSPRNFSRPRLSW